MPFWKVPECQWLNKEMNRSKRKIYFLIVFNFFYSTLLRSRSFFGRIEGKKTCFRDFLAFIQSLDLYSSFLFFVYYVWNPRWALMIERCAFPFILVIFNQVEHKWTNKSKTSQLIQIIYKWGFCPVFWFVTLEYS